MVEEYPKRDQLKVKKAHKALLWSPFNKENSLIVLLIQREIES